MKYRWEKQNNQQGEKLVLQKTQWNLWKFSSMKKDSKEQRQIIKTTNKSSAITTELTEIKMIRRECYG